MHQDLKRIFLENAYLKSSIAIIALFSSWVFNGEYQAVIAIFVLILADALTGTYFAVKNANWCSEKAKQGAGKIGRYFIYILVARMVDKVVPVPFASPIIDSFIALTEAGSIMENFYKLGYPVPTILLKKLKTFNEKKG